MPGKSNLPREMMANFYEDFYWVYVLKSLKDGKNYTGYSKHLPSRFEAHQKGEVQSTRNRRPLEIIYVEGCLNQKDALKREKYLKTHYGKMYLRNRLAKWFSQSE